MANRERPRQLHFMVSDTELALIRHKMEQAGVRNMGAYLRKMAIDGYVVRLDLSDVRELVSLLRRTSNNTNQIAKRVNQTGSLYAEDLADLQANHKKLWEALNGILGSLAALE